MLYIITLSLCCHYQFKIYFGSDEKTVSSQDQRLKREKYTRDVNMSAIKFVEPAFLLSLKHLNFRAKECPKLPSTLSLSISPLNRA
jgi:hypothetical protein